MKKKLFMLIPVAAMLFSCTPSKAPSSSSSMSGGDSSSISESIYDDTSSEIEIIDDSPTTSYNEQTKKMIRDMLTTFGLEEVENTANMIETYCLKLGVGDALLQKTISFVVEQYEMGRDGKFYENADELKKAYYDLLSILSSIDFSKIKDLLQYIDQTIMDSYKEELKQFTISSVYPYIYQDETLKKVYEVYDNPDFRTAYNAHMLPNVTVNYTEGQQKVFQEEYDELKAKSEKGVIPQVVYVFLERNANRARDVVVKDLKIVVDSLFQLLFAYSKKAMELSGSAIGNTNSTRMYFYSYDYNYGYGSIFSSYANGEEESYTSELILYMLDLLNANKEGIKNVIKGLFERDSSISFILDTVRDLVLPLLFELIPAVSEEQEQYRKAFLAQLADLNDQHIAAIISFIINLIDKIDFADFKELVKDSHSEPAMEVADKYMKILKDQIAGTAAEDKLLIFKLSVVFGVDILSELDTLASLFALRKTLGAEVFQAQLDKWGEEFGEKVEEVMEPLFDYEAPSAPSSGTPTDTKQLRVSISSIRDADYNYYYTNNLPKDLVITPDMVYVDIYDGGWNYICYGNLASLVQNGTITVSGFNFDTSKLGFTEGKFVIDMVEGDYEPYDFCTYLTIYPENYVRYSTLSLYGYGSVSLIGNSEYLYGIQKDEQAYYNDEQTYDAVYVDTSTKGYHFVQNGSRWTVYYVYDIKDLTVKTTSYGYGFQEGQTISRNPYYVGTTTIPGLGETLVRSGSYTLMGKEGLNYSVGKHSYVDPESGFSYDYIIFKKANGVLTEMEVYLRPLIPYMYKALGMEIPEGDEYEMFRQNLPSVFEVEAYSYYHYTDPDTGFMTSDSEYGKVTLTHLKVENGHLCFTLNGEDYSLSIYKDNLIPLTDLKIYY